MRHPLSHPPHAPHPDGALSQLGVRLAANVLALGVVVGGALWWLSPGDDAVEMADRMARIEAENMRLASANQDLDATVDELGYKNEILHWQLKFTEQSLRQEQELSARAADDALASRKALARAQADASRLRRAKVQLLQADAATDASTDGLSDQVDAAAGTDTPDEQLAAPARTDTSRPLRLADAEVEFAALAPEWSQLDRDMAYRTWEGVVTDAVDGECRRSGTYASYKCEDEVRRALWPYATRAVSCVMSGNAVPDYIEERRNKSLPTHTVLLEKGAVMLCDGALRNEGADG